MLPIMLNELGKAAIREVSGMLVFKEGLSGAVLGDFRIMALEGGINMVL